ncbi:beta strand repeat-containing protein [Halosegnis longus]|uniref:beta strand repeat-containing protein n=1 Tax=Halosegnis longus TaxID=2216012 RepID=UPI00129E95EC|nr:hypothetical protein [Halosegnis longus]
MSPATFTTELPEPTNLTIINDAGDLAMSWTVQSSDQTGFAIYRKDSTGSVTQIATVGSTTTSYTDTAVSPTDDYTYSVEATTEDATSEYNTATWTNGNRPVTAWTSANVTPETERTASVSQTLATLGVGVASSVTSTASAATTNSASGGSTTAGGFTSQQDESDMTSMESAVAPSDETTTTTDGATITSTTQTRSAAVSTSSTGVSATGQSGLVSHDSGTFVTPSTTGTQQITDVGFEPDLVVFDATNTNGQFGTEKNSGSTYGLTRGAAHRSRDGEISEQYISAASDSHSTNEASGEAGFGSSLHVLFHNDAITGTIDASCVSMDSDGFTLDYSTVDPGSKIMHSQVLVQYTAYEFDDPSRASVGHFRCPDSARTITESVGTNADYIELRASNIVGGPTDTNNATPSTYGHTFGWIVDDGSITQITAAQGSEPTNINSHHSSLHTDSALSIPFQNTDTIDGETRATATDLTDGLLSLDFTSVNSSNTGRSQNMVLYVAMDTGGQTPELAVTETPTSPSTIGVPAGFEPAHVELVQLGSVYELNTTKSFNNSPWGWTFGTLDAGAEHYYGYWVNSTSTNTHRAASATGKSIRMDYVDAGGNNGGSSTLGTMSAAGDGTDLTYSNISDGNGQRLADGTKQVSIAWKQPTGGDGRTPVISTTRNGDVSSLLTDASLRAHSTGSIRSAIPTTGTTVSVEQTNSQLSDKRPIVATDQVTNCEPQLVSVTSQTASSTTSTDVEATRQTAGSDSTGATAKITCAVDVTTSATTVQTVDPTTRTAAGDERPSPEIAVTPSASIPTTTTSRGAPVDAELSPVPGEQGFITKLDEPGPITVSTESATGSVTTAVVVPASVGTGYTVTNPVYPGSKTVDQTSMTTISGEPLNSAARLTVVSAVSTTQASTIQSGPPALTIPAEHTSVTSRTTGGAASTTAVTSARTTESVSTRLIASAIGLVSTGAGYPADATATSVTSEPATSATAQSELTTVACTVRTGTGLTTQTSDSETAAISGSATDPSVQRETTDDSISAAGQATGTVSGAKTIVTDGGVSTTSSSATTSTPMTTTTSGPAPGHATATPGDGQTVLTVSAAVTTATTSPLKTTEQTATVVPGAPVVGSARVLSSIPETSVISPSTRQSATGTALLSDPQTTAVSGNRTVTSSTVSPAAGPVLLEAVAGITDTGATTVVCDPLTAIVDHSQTEQAETATIGVDPAISTTAGSTVDATTAQFVGPSSLTANASATSADVGTERDITATPHTAAATTTQLDLGSKNAVTAISPIAGAITTTESPAFNASASGRARTVDPKTNTTAAPTLPQSVTNTAGEGETTTTATPAVTTVSTRTLDDTNLIAFPSPVSADGDALIVDAQTTVTGGARTTATVTSPTVSDPETDTLDRAKVASATVTETVVTASLTGVVETQHSAGQTISVDPDTTVLTSDATTNTTTIVAVTDPDTSVVVPSDPAHGELIGHTIDPMTTVLTADSLTGVSGATITAAIGLKPGVPRLSVSLDQFINRGSFIGWTPDQIPERALTIITTDRELEFRS